MKIKFGEWNLGKFNSVNMDPLQSLMPSILVRHEIEAVQPQLDHLPSRLTGIGVNVFRHGFESEWSRLNHIAPLEWNWKCCVSVPCVRLLGIHLVEDEYSPHIKRRDQTQHSSWTVR